MTVGVVDADNPVEGDLALSGGTLVFTTDFSTEVAQRIRGRLRMFLGEWFLDQRLGLPYFQRVLVKNPSLRILRAIFGAVIQNTAGVQSVDSLTPSIDVRTRTLSLDFTCTLEDGSALRSKAYGPFIVRF